VGARSEVWPPVTAWYHPVVQKRGQIRENCSIFSTLFVHADLLDCLGVIPQRDGPG
jgi:hypothetical protein